MKLPSEPTNNIKPSSPAQPSTAGAKVSQSTALPNTEPTPTKSIQALINTWARVESSQVLPDKQNQQVLNQLALLAGNHSKIPFTDSSKSTGISEKLNLSNLMQSLNKSEPLSDKLTLVLVKLMSVKGAVSILTNRAFSSNSTVLLGQSPEGKLTIQTQQTPTQLNQFRSQFVLQNTVLKPILLSNNNQNSTQETRIGFTFSPIPNTTLQSNVPLAPNILKQAILNSGQNLESKLIQLLQTQASATKPSLDPLKNAATSIQNTSIQNQSNSTPSDAPTANMQSKISQVEQNIQKWVAHFQQKMNGPSNTAQSPSSSTPPPLTPASPTSSASTGSGSLSSAAVEIKSVNSHLMNTITSYDTLKHDHKSWLIQNQNQMIEQLSKQLLQRKDSFIPQWPTMAFQGAQAGDSIKTFQDLSQWLTLLMLPKTNSDAQGQSLWPKPLAVQPQLQHTLSTLLNSMNQSSHDSEAALLKQLLNVTQSLAKLTHDQIQNRFSQAQDNPQFQLSLPYLHQNQIQWCDFECKQQTPINAETEKTNGWHLILRFAQQTKHAFAVESHLKQEQLAVTLWASESDQLQYLHQHIPLIKNKLENAGFKVDSISSKHGAPKPLQQPIQQSLIDVHT